MCAINVVVSSMRCSSLANLQRSCRTTNKRRWNCSCVQWMWWGLCHHFSRMSNSIPPPSICSCICLCPVTPQAPCTILRAASYWMIIHAWAIQFLLLVHLLVLLVSCHTSSTLAQFCVQQLIGWLFTHEQFNSFCLCVCLCPVTPQARLHNFACSSLLGESCSILL